MFIKQVIINFKGFDEWYNGLVPERIHFEWINADQLDYRNYLRKQSILKSIKTLPFPSPPFPLREGIRGKGYVESYLNLPFDIEYSSWGQYIKRSEDLITVKNVTPLAGLVKILITLLLKL